MKEEILRESYEDVSINEMNDATKQLLENYILLQFDKSVQLIDQVLKHQMEQVARGTISALAEKLIQD